MSEKETEKLGTKINIVVNEPIRLVSGGYKVIYQYANFLSKNHCEVCIYYRCRRNVLYSNFKIPFFIKILVAKVLLLGGVNWFAVDKAIESKIITHISDETVQDGDIVIATAVDTADEVNRLNQTKGRKYYFIQGFEDWVADESRVKQTYSLGMTNIVVARWLKAIVDKEGKKESIYIPNGIDDNAFYIENPIPSRNPASVAVLYHPQQWKGAQDAIEVLRNVKKLHNDLYVEMFGICDRPSDLPEWINYTKSATQNQLLEIYNHSAVFLCTSWSEGFGLTGAESMFCGCALVTTDTLGVREYADENNSMICKPRDINALTKAVCELIEKNDFRIQLAERGHDAATRQLNFSASCQKFKDALDLDE